MADALLPVEHRHPPTAPATSGLLRWSAAAYESAQRSRVRSGEQLRAVLQGRDETWGAAVVDGGDPDAVLADIRAGRSLGPVPVLGRSYHRHWAEEREMYALMAAAVERHPTWPWLSRVRGVGPTLATRLLSRLSIERAPTPSSFWAYCGLSTVPGVTYRCDHCATRLRCPANRGAPPPHSRPGGRSACSGALRVDGADIGVRVAQPRPSRGEARPYDGSAKVLCYLIGVSFLRRGGAYADHYRQRRARLEGERPDWNARRRHLTALRHTEKLFLAHLWLVWREAVGLPTMAPYAHAHLDGARVIGPWEMVEAVTPRAPAG